MSVQITDTVIKVTGVQVIKAQEALVAAIAAATATTIAAAVPAAAPAGGIGAAEGGWDTATNRDLAITTINDLRTHAIEMDLDYEALLVDVADIRTKMNDLLTKIKAHGLIASA
ncbi:MAG: hypothetical protein Q8M94_03910 [Ignavibacteria bacterium]|nr:hypothetical protein [Ignavibacteria bacterium]